MDQDCGTGDGSHLRVCDPCWEVLGTWLVIVSGDEVVTARCDGCGAYFNPRDMAEVRSGGRKDAYAGTCQACAEEGNREASEKSAEETTKGENDGEEDPRLRTPLQGLLVRRW